MADDQLKFELDLDASKFKEGIDAARQTLADLSKSSQFIKGGLEFLQKYAVALGAIYAAYKLLSSAVSVVFDAEQIKAVNQQFELLSKNAGLAADKLREDLVGASGGLADDTDIIRAASKAIIGMGESASRLPEIMQMARQVTAAFGGDLTQNFESISTALSTGNTRMLKQFGIIVDSDKAMRNYAQSVGKATSELTDAERRQVTMTAALEHVKTALSGTNEDIKKNQTLWKQTQVIFAQIGESATLIFSKTLEPAVSNFLQKLNGTAKSFKTFVTATFGDGPEKSRAQVERLEAELAKLQTRMLENSKFDNLLIPVGELPVMEARIRRINDELFKLRETSKTAVEVPAVEPKKPKKEFDPAAAQRETQFEADMLKLKLRRIDLEQSKASTVAEFNQREQERRAVALEQMNAEIMAVEAKDMNQKQRLLEIEQIRLQYAEQERQRLIDMDQLQMQVYENQLRSAQNVAEGTAAAFRQGGAQASQDLKNFGKQGQMVFKSFENNAVSSLQAFGAGTQTASEAAKGFMMGMLADIAEAYGRMMMLTAFETFPAVNVGKLAAGAALVALSGYFRSQSGGKGSGGGGSGSGMSGGGGGFEGGGSGPASASQFEQQKKTVTVNISGNYMDTDQTRMRMVEMIREASDATDFRYVQVGGS